jgi:hypothetical protein
MTYTVTNLTPAEFEAAQEAGSKFYRSRDEFFWDGEEYFVVTYPAYANDNGCMKYDRKVVYKTA